MSTVPGLCDLAALSVSETTMLPEEISGPSVEKNIVNNDTNSSLTVWCLMCEAWHYNKYLLGCGDDISEVTSCIWRCTVFNVAAGWRKNTNDSLFVNDKQQ